MIRWSDDQMIKWESDSNAGVKLRSSLPAIVAYNIIIL